MKLLAAAVLVLVLTAPAAAQVSLLGCAALDGDGIKCGRVSIRLVGFDALEICEPRGEEARARLAWFLSQGLLTLRFLGRDVYGRVLARGTVGGVELAILMRDFWRDRKIPRPRCQTYG